MKLFAAVLAAAVALVSPAAAQEAKRIVLPGDVVPIRYDIKVTPDAEKLTFDGEAKIAVEVKAPTREIVLNAADLAIAKASLSGRKDAPKITLDEEQQRATLTFATPVAPGRYDLSFVYSGKIYTQASGLFALDYDTPQGKKRALFTQFEAADARRFVPSWDEPAHKAIFGLTVVGPKDQMFVSNMPAAATRDLGDGQKSVRFADSPRMSSYLLFVAMGDFDRITTKVGNTEIGVVTRKGAAEQGRYALDSAAKLLAYYNDYFGTPYPLPKLDLLAGPGQGQFFGAMENWGAIFYFEYYLLLDPATSTVTDRQNVFSVVAHEMAHQWFGDLVTMAWWDDLWLNEGFASWMENKATAQLNPEWDYWLQNTTSRERAMRLDAGAGTHPIIRPIPDILTTAGAFDSITYNKGEAVIRMLEQDLGEAPFREGVRSYMKKHAYNNTVTDDLWRELDAASGRSISDIAHDFTLQPGIPLIQVDAAPGGLRLSQGRFSATDPRQEDLSWRVPVTVAGPGTPTWHGLVSANAPVTIPAQPGAVVNAGQTSYFRTAYAPAVWGPLAARFASIDPADQLGLLADARALGEAGYAPFGNFLDLAANASPDANPRVLNLLAEQLDAIDTYYDGQPGQAAFRAFARSRLAPVVARVGWEPRAGESDEETLLRTRVLETMGALGDPAVIAEARRRFAGYLADRSTLTGNARSSVLNIVAANADETTWEQIHQLAKAATQATEKSRLYELLGDSHDPALADRALALALTEEAPVPDRPSIIAEVGKIFPEKAFDYALAHRAAVEETVETGSREIYYAGMADYGSTAEFAQKVEAFAKGLPEGSRLRYARSLSSINQRLRIVSQRLPEIDAWLAAHQR